MDHEHQENELAFAGATSAIDDDMIAWLRHAHSQQLALCDELEAIADSLPANVNRQKCIYAGKTLAPMIRSLHFYEETVLFPQVRKRGAECNDGEMLTRLRYEHLEDEGYAEELAEVLLKLGAGSAVNMEATGYMLRGFFASLRRHIAFEKAHILRDSQAAPQG